MIDEPKIGPTGEFPFGGPASQVDRGGIWVSFAVIPKPLVIQGRSYRLCRWSFGTTVSYFETTFSQARATAAVFREAIKEALGEMSYDKTKLEPETGIRVLLAPIVVSGERLVRIDFPRSTAEVIANPHVFLSIAHHIDDRIREAENAGR